MQLDAVVRSRTRWESYSPTAIRHSRGPVLSHRRVASFSSPLLGSVSSRWCAFACVFWDSPDHDQPRAPQGNRSRVGSAACCTARNVSLGFSCRGAGSSTRTAGAVRHRARRRIDRSVSHAHARGAPTPWSWARARDCFDRSCRVYALWCAADCIRPRRDCLSTLGNPARLRMVPQEKSQVYRARSRDHSIDDLFFLELPTSQSAMHDAWASSNRSGHPGILCRRG